MYNAALCISAHPGHEETMGIVYAGQSGRGGRPVKAGRFALCNQKTKSNRK